jgi:hypothetical protein
MDTARFFTADACRAAGIDTATLKNWISRDPPAILLTENDRASHVSGRPHLLTFRRVVQITIVAELVRLGWGPRVAAIAAATFTDSGNSRRQPLELFPEGATLLIARPDAPESAKVARALDLVSWASITGPGARGATVLDLSAIIADVERTVA